MSDQDYENTIAHLDERIAELRLEAIAATGQAQTALEENAKLKQAARAFLGVRDYDSAEEYIAKRSALAALLGGE